MTPGAPTDGARSRFPGHRGSTEAGTILKDSGKRRCSSKGLACGSALIDEAWAEPRFGDPVTRSIGPHTILQMHTRLALLATGDTRTEGPAGVCLRAPPPRVSDT